MADQREDYYNAHRDDRMFEVPQSRLEEMTDTIKRLTADLAAAQQRIAELEAGQRWIPVEERLPEEGQYVLARSRSMYAQTYHSWWYSNSLRDVFARDNSHWLPLPPPPSD